MSKQKINRDQKNKLLDLLQNNPLLRSGKFSASFTHRDAQKEWEVITQILNAIPGANKDWKAWRKTWQDILSKTKSKTATINRIRRTTGGGPPPKESLDEFEEGVAALLHPHSISGHTESQESAVIFQDVVPIQQHATSSNLAVDAPLLPLPTVSDSHTIQEINDAIILPPPLEYTGASGSNSEVSDAIILPPPLEYTGASGSNSEVVPIPQQTTGKKKKTKVNMKTLLQEKLKIKKEMFEEKKKFYQSFISNMERQTQALEDVSRGLIIIGQSLNNSRRDI